jgi:CelD/BcsL family acetyltransferase involved in cellulose biosynthesis
VGVAVRVDVVKPEELTEDHKSFWRQKQNDTPYLASPFLSYQFTQAVGRVRRDAFVAIIESDGRLSGFLPFERRPCGLGVPIGNRLSDVQAVIAEPGLRLDMAKILKTCGLGALSFTNLRAEQTCFAPDHMEVEPSYCIDISEGYEGYVEECRTSGTAVLRRAAKKTRGLTREVGPVRFSLKECSKEILQTLLSWKIAQYQRTGAFNAFEARWAPDLIDDLFHTDDSEFGGVLSALWAGDKLIAAHFGIRSKNILHCWFPAYDPAYARYSPGQILMQKMAEHAGDLGVTLIEFGCGDYRFKQSFSNREIGVAKAIVGRRSLVGASYALRMRIQKTAEQLPLGPISAWPRKAFDHVDRYLLRQC